MPDMLFWFEFEAMMATACLILFEAGGSIDAERLRRLVITEHAHWVIHEVDEAEAAELSAEKTIFKIKGGVASLWK